MGHVRMQTHVNTPIEKAFDYATDFKRTPEWHVGIIEVKADEPLTRVGAKFIGRSKFLGRVLEGTGEITAYERPRLVSFVSSSGEGGYENWITRFTEADGGTDIEVTIDYEPPRGILGAIADRLFIEREMQRSMDQSRDNFIALVEHEHSPVPA